ncbi:MAG: hypothetical protein IID46_02290, partial [Planctomycetes bacterium]|nr:hypothetical protein [Planctomycetota bacterium]
MLLVIALGMAAAYGIGFVGNCQQLLACYTDDYTLPKLVLRPDRLGECSIGMGSQPVLQRILPSGIFRHAVEMKLFRALHRAMLIRAGFEKPRRQETQDWWSDSPTQQAKNRRTYHGLKRSALYITNGLVAELLETVADKEALRVARRYPLAYRGPIYMAAARSPRACQLTETFPLLAIMAYGGGKPPDGIGEVRESV